MYKVKDVYSILSSINKYISFEDKHDYKINGVRVFTANNKLILNNLACFKIENDILIIYKKFGMVSIVRKFNLSNKNECVDVISDAIMKVLNNFLVVLENDKQLALK